MIEIIIGLFGSVLSRVFDTLNEKMKSKNKQIELQYAKEMAMLEHSHEMERMAFTSKAALDLKDIDLTLKSYDHDITANFSGRTSFGSILQDISSFSRSIVRPALTLVLGVYIIFAKVPNESIISIFNVIIGWWFGDRSIKIK